MISSGFISNVRSRIRLLFRNVNLSYLRWRHGVDYYRDGVDILSADWDNLLLMDACRYDMFVDQVDLPGTLSKKKSRGSMTAQFLSGNFDGRDATDVVYVTANPMYRRIEQDHDFRFHAVVDAWHDWDEENSTVLPETVVSEARRARRKYPDKRLLVHFLQPHFPFIDSETEFDKQIPDPKEDDDPQFWEQLRTGELSLTPEKVWKPYNQNLKLLVPTLETLVQELDGKTIVTSDHGNMVGDRSRPIPVSDWGHPRGLYTPELIDVPWLVCDAGERREVVAESPETDEEIDSETVRNRLHNLGYAE